MLFWSVFALIIPSFFFCFYSRDVLVFEEVGRSPDVATNYGFSKKILLCYSPDNHYDSVYPKLYIVKAAFCQCKYFYVTNKQLRNKLNIFHISILSF